MFSRCFLVLLCLLLGGLLEARPIPQKDNTIREPSAEMIEMLARVFEEEAAAPPTKPHITVIVGDMKNRYKGDSIKRNNALMKIAMSRRMASQKGQDSHKPQNRGFFSKGEETEPRTMGQTLVGGIGFLLKWLLISLAVIIAAIYFTYRYLCCCWNFISRHSDKIPVKKIMKVYQKPGALEDDD